MEDGRGRLIDGTVKDVWGLATFPPPSLIRSLPSAILHPLGSSRPFSRLPATSPFHLPLFTFRPPMRGDEDLPGPERPWDEHDWERFLRRQDRRTEQYLGLVERYADHPDRDRLIAREMGWTHLADASNQSDEDFGEADGIPPTSAEDLEDDALPDDENEVSALFFYEHPLWKEACVLAAEARRVVDPRQRRPPAVETLMARFLHGVNLCSVKIGAVLTDPPGAEARAELGMEIAYLKRALKALTDALDALVALREAGEVPPPDALALQQRVFSVRSGLIECMGQRRDALRREMNREDGG